MDIQFGDTVVDGNDKRIGSISKVILDTWSGEPRKYAVRLEGKVDMVFFTPQQVDTASKDKVKLTVTKEEIESA
jgi:Fe-S cluster assembly iron-binding protein IscA